MTESTTYPFSQASLRQSWLDTLVILIFLPIALAVFMLVIPSPLPTATRLIIIIAITIPVELIMIVSLIITQRKIRELTLTLSPQTLARRGGQATEMLNYADINRVEIVEKPAGQVVFIKLATTSGQRLNLQGFEQMETVAQQLTERLPDQTPVQRKRWRIDRSGKLYKLAAFAVPFLGMAVLMSLSQYAFNLIYIILISSVGVYFLRAKPLTRSLGKRFETFEKISGVIMIVTAIITGVTLLLTLSFDWASGL